MRHPLVGSLLATALAVGAAAQNSDPQRPPDAPAEPAPAVPTTPSGGAPPSTGGASSPADASSPAAPGVAAAGGAPTDFQLVPSSADPLDGLGWRAWWRFNGEAYLDLDASLAEIDRSRAGDATSGAAPRESNGVLAEQVRDKVVPALRAMVVEGADPAQVRAALIALGRIESSWSLPEELRLRSFAPKLVSSSNHDLGEAALVALGLSGRKDTLDDLVEVLSDSSVGRALCNSSPVDHRRRAFAAYALGLTALMGHDDITSRRSAGELMATLRAPKEAPLDVQLACLTALGFAPLPACLAHAEADWHVCRTTELDFLSELAGDAKRAPRLRAQACLALAQVAAVALDSGADGARELLVEALAASSKAPPEVVQACALGLGLLGDADEDPLDERIRDGLLRASNKGDRLARGFALISLAKVGARPGRGLDRGKARDAIRQQLVGRLGRSQDDRAGWAALALGVHGRALAVARQRSAHDLTSELRLALAGSRSPDDAAAACVALALLRDAAAAPALIARLDKSQEPGLRSCAALALGWIGASSANEPLSRLFLAGPRGNDLFAPAATGLRLLGSPTVVPGMVEMLHVELSRKDARSMATCAALLGRLGDARAIESLVRIAGDDRQRSELRAACAGALAEICDTHPRPWSVAIAADGHFGLFPSTLASSSANGTGLLEMR